MTDAAPHNPFKSASMTPEQRSEQIVKDCEHAGLFGDESGACAYCIAAALQPSAAVRELLRAADELRTIMHLDGPTKTPRYDKAAAAVREELGL